MSVFMILFFFTLLISTLFFFIPEFVITAKDSHGRALTDGGDIFSVQVLNNFS